MKPRLLPLFALLWLLGCSWIADPTQGNPRCIRPAGKNDPCPTGHACVSGRCEAILCATLELCLDHIDNDCDGRFDEQNAPNTELCGDRVDNDCDSRIDELPNPNNPEICGNGVDDDCDGEQDEGHDQDMDKYAWCGDTEIAGGGGKADCDDYDPTVHPGAPELCDGRDNDCDSRVDETTSGPLCPTGWECVRQHCVVPDCTVEGSSAQCTGGLMCDPVTRKCVPPGCSAETCPSGQYCDRTSGECRATKRRNGDVCIASSDCASGVCIDQAALRVPTLGSRVCGEACCADSDCAPDERCFVSGSGARSCLPLTLAPPPKGALTQCLDRSQCETGEICAVVPGQPLGAPASPQRNDLVSPACEAPPLGSLGVGRNCPNDEACASRECVPGSGILFSTNVCSRTCQTSTDCRELVISGSLLDGLSGVYCRFVERGSEADYLPVCVVNRGEAGGGSFGAACSSGSDCQEGACVGAEGDLPGFCAVACCRDRDCGTLQNTLTHCQPIAFGGHYEMRCMP